MHLTHYERNNIYIVAFEGDLTNNNAKACNQYLRPILDKMKKSKHKNRILLDLTGVPHMDSAGLGLICGKFIGLKKQEKKLALCNLKPSVRHTFSIVGVDETIPIYSTLMEGLHYLSL